MLRWTGAAYLIWMGVSMLRSARRDVAPAPDVSPVTTTEVHAPRDFLAGWRRGAATNLLNPKMGAFYVALLPQFIPAGATPLTFGVLLACVHIALGVAWSALLVVVARRLRPVLQRPRTRRVMDAVTGTVIAGFGLKLAVSSR